MLVLVGMASASAQTFDGPRHPSPIMPDRKAYDAFYSSFVEVSCCWTNQCCFEIDERDVVDLGNNAFRIVASGQVVTRKGYSPDGGYHRCACDPQPSPLTAFAIPQHWHIWAGANTRCLFTPSNGS